MIHPEHTVVAIDSCTIPFHYNNPETVTKDRSESAPTGFRVLDERGQTVSIPFSPGQKPLQESGNVRVRVKDLVRGLQAMATSQLAWLDDLGDDPIILTRDFYEVFIACQEVRRSA
jgi:hypothetical protein